MIQLQVLNYILESRDFSIITKNSLNASYFPAYESEFNYIKNHVNTYNNVPDKTSFLNIFPDFDIIKVTESTTYLLDTLYQEHKKRHITNTFNTIRNLILADKTDEAEALLVNLNNSSSQYKHLESTDLLSDISRFDKYVDKRDNYTKFYTKTGFPELDKFTGGWDRKEEFATIVGRPGIGKSYILFKCALASAEQGLTVGIYEGEMTKDNVGYRIDTLISHISNGQILHGNSNIQDEYKNHLDNLSKKIPGKLKILTSNDLGKPATISDLRAFIEKDNLDILYVDQYSLLDDERNAKSKSDKTSNISQDLKNLQVQKQIPIITASQQNREKEETGCDLRQIAQSDMIGQHSTTVIFLEQKDGILSMHLVKSRYSGGGKTLKYKVDYDKGLYLYIPEEEDNSTSQEDLEELKNSYEVPLTVNGEDAF